MALKDIVETLIKRLVEKPDQVEIKESQGERGLVFEVRVAQVDMGRVIGRKGKTIEALRTIVNACGIKHEKRCSLQLIEEDRPPA